MSRIKRGTTANKRRKNILAKVKGYRFGRSTKFKEAKTALAHASAHAFRDRKRKKREFRRLWTIKINAAVRTLGLSYSKFIDKLHKNNIGLNRKVLAEMAEHRPEAFKAIVEKVS